jgi:hypothetical protein
MAAAKLLKLQIQPLGIFSLQAARTINADIPQILRESWSDTGNSFKSVCHILSLDRAGEEDSLAFKNGNNDFEHRCIMHIVALIKIEYYWKSPSRLL